MTSPPSPSSSPSSSPFRMMPVIAFLPALPVRPARPVPRLRRIPRRHAVPAVAVAPPPRPPSALPELSIPDILLKPSKLSNSKPAKSVPISQTPPARPPPPQSPFSYLWPRFLLLAVAGIWGTNFPVVKLLHTPPDPLPVPTAALARFTLASVAMLPFIPAELKAANRKSFPLPFLVSTLCIGGAISAAYFSQSIALMTTDASTSAFICSLAVVVVPILNRFANAMGWIPKADDRGFVATWGAPFLAVIGVAMLEFGGTPPSIGDVWAFVQALGFALGFVLNDRVAEKYPDLVFSQSAVQLNVVAVLALVWAIVDSSATAGAFTFPHISAAFMHVNNALALMYTGLITTAMTVWLENVALKKVSAGELAVLLSTEPFWAAALAAALLGETMGPPTIVGGAVILLACVVNQAGGTNMADILGNGKGKTETKVAVKKEKADLVGTFKKEEPR